MKAQLAFLVIFVALQVADVLTTLKALDKGNREANPVLANIFKYVSPWKALLLFKAVSIWLVWYADMYILTGLLCAFYVWVIDNNLRVIRGE
jgi:hypothetical protein